MRDALICSLALVLLGCAPTNSVPDADDADSINTVAMSCQSPYELEQDCSSWSGATRNLVIEGFEVRVSATQDGHVVLVMETKLYSNSLKDWYTLNSHRHSTASNKSYTVIKKVLEKAGIGIKRVRPLRSLGNVDGYILELESDGYTLLKKYTIS